MSTAPDFYLGSGDSKELNKHPRACSVIREVDNPRGDKGLLVTVVPPLDASFDKETGGSKDYVVLATRHEGASLVPISAWPVEVYVVYVTEGDPAETEIVRAGAYRIGWWGTLYRTMEEALADVYDMG